jgi:hypothetical protein
MASPVRRYRSISPNRSPTAGSCPRRTLSCQGAFAGGWLFAEPEHRSSWGSSYGRAVEQPPCQCRACSTPAPGDKLHSGGPAPGSRRAGRRPTWRWSRRRRLYRVRHAAAGRMRSRRAPLMCASLTAVNGLRQGGARISSRGAVVRGGQMRSRSRPPLASFPPVPGYRVCICVRRSVRRGAVEYGPVEPSRATVSP